MLRAERRGAAGSQRSVDNGRSNVGGTRNITHEHVGCDDRGPPSGRSTGPATRKIDPTGKEETV
jgi:hypothetical protein